MDATQRLERLQEEVQSLDRQQKRERLKKQRHFSSTAGAEKVIAFYVKTCRLSQQKEDEYFMHCLGRNEFHLNVSRMQSVADSEEHGDALSTFLKVLRCGETVSTVHSISIIDESDSKRSRDKEVIGSRIAVALCHFLKRANSAKTTKTTKRAQRVRAPPPRCKLERVFLRGLCIESKRHWEMLSDGLSAVGSLRSLSLQNVPLRDCGAAILCGALRRSELNVLSLPRCGLTAASAQSIVRLMAAHWNNRQSMSWQRALRVKERESASKWNEGGFDPKAMGLTAVDLSQNALRDDGLRVIAEALREDAGILWLDLRANGMTNCALSDVMKMLKRNTKLLHFDLTQNSGIRPETASEILAILEMRRSLNAAAIDSALTPKTRHFNAKRTTTRIPTRTASAGPSRRSSRRKSLKSTPSTAAKAKRKRRASTTAKVPPSKKRKALRTKTLSAASSRAKRATNRRAAARGAAAVRVRAVGPRPPSAARSGGGVNANKMLRDILSEYKSTKMQCHKLTKQKETISQIVESLEATLNRFNQYIDTMQRRKVQIEASPQTLSAGDQTQLQRHDAVGDTETAHNVIEHRLRQIWDSRLSQ